MSPLATRGESHPDFRPWYREPWVWLLIALPAISIIGCAITIWLALTRPDYRVVDEQQQRQLESGFHALPANPDTAAATEPEAASKNHGDG